MALRELATAVQAHPRLTVVILGVVAAVAWVARARHKASREADLPFLRFEDGDDSRQRYATDSGTLFKIGYDRYLKHGQAFKMRNYIGELSPQVYLPLKYLDEVKTAPQAKLSVPYYSVLVSCRELPAVRAMNALTKVALVPVIALFAELDRNGQANR